MLWMKLNRERLIKLNLMGLALAATAIGLSLATDLIPPLLRITLSYFYVIVGSAMFIQVYRAQVIIVENTLSLPEQLYNKLEELYKLTRDKRSYKKFKSLQELLEYLIDKELKEIEEKNERITKGKRE